MANDITHRMRCIAAIIGEFRWQKVTALYEDRNNDFTTNNMAVLKLLSDSLRDVNSEIANHIAFSLSDPKQFTEEKPMNLSSNCNRVYVLVQYSVATLLFKKAKKLNMMSKGYVWIVADEIANLLDSLDSSAFHNLQGVIGCKIYFEERKTSFRNSKPNSGGIICLNSQKKKDKLTQVSLHFELMTHIGPLPPPWMSCKEINGRKKIVESNFEGLSGAVGFKNGILSHVPTFQIINIFGKSYKEVAF